ncbi:MAG: ADP-ribosylglycohydrolase family protein [Phycisphaerales bacterium]|nr:ADP-ribosylglycohydrolase family protein [Phycisphaerales bacterium]MCB9862520.1 ADP-ribosylglycohydrolase family protein [Phycisphaerales bacterium]
MDFEARLQLARRSLLGLSVGDGFGQQFFSGRSIFWLQYKTPPEAPWRWTDDTAMAIEIVAELAEGGEIDQDRLSKRFVDRYVAEPDRGYGWGAMRLLKSIHEGDDWRDKAPRMFEGTGSMGNGSAMRVAPLGAFFAGDPDIAAEQARLSSEVTHFNPDGIDGAIAVAVAANLIAGGVNDPDALFDGVISRLADTTVRCMIDKARNLSPEASIEEAVGLLGSGDAVLAWDTVPFTLWIAFHSLDDYEAALWRCVEGRGDRDTTSAIVGGMLAAGGVMPPEAWIEATEPLPS